MHTEITLQSAPEVARIVRAAFPNYRRHTAVILTSEKCTLHNTFWDGGTRYEYVAVDLGTGTAKGAPHYNPPQFGGPRIPPVVDIPEGVVIVQGGTFCGKVARVHIYIRDENLTKLLPAS